MVKYLVTFVKFSVTFVISGVSGDSRESTWPEKTQKKKIVTSFYMITASVMKGLRTPFLQNTSALMAASGSKQCKLNESIHWKFMLPRRKWYTWTVLWRLVFLSKEYSSEVSQTPLAVPHFSKVAGKNLKPCNFT